MADIVKTKNPESVKGFSKVTFIGSRRTGMGIAIDVQGHMAKKGSLLQFKLEKK